MDQVTRKVVGRRRRKCKQPLWVIVVVSIARDIWYRDLISPQSGRLKASAYEYWRQPVAAPGPKSGFLE